MNFLTFVGSIFTLVYGVSAVCKSTNSDGARCLTEDEGPWWFARYMKGETCFDNGGSNWCFTSKNGNMAPCKCFDDNQVYDNEFCNPAVYGDGNTLCKYGDGTAPTCGVVVSRGIESQADKDAIVGKHNDLRSRVARGKETLGVGGKQPSAANMRQMVWSDELAAVAQKWTDQCTPGHDKNRKTKNHGSVGQNYAMMGSSRKSAPTDWGQFVQNWYKEVKDFPAKNVQSFSKNGATGEIGHYTQVVWAESYEVGCGYIEYPDGRWFKKILICNYGPAGNASFNGKGKPVYIKGSPGSKCPSGTSKTSAGLCA